MFRLLILGIALAGVLASLILGFARVVPLEVSGILVTVFVGVSSLVLTYLSLKQKENDN